MSDPPIIPYDPTPPGGMIAIRQREDGTLTIDVAPQFPALIWRTPSEKRRRWRAIALVVASGWIVWCLVPLVRAVLNRPLGSVDWWETAKPLWLMGFIVALQWVVMYAKHGGSARFVANDKELAISERVPLFVSRERRVSIGRIETVRFAPAGDGLFARSDAGLLVQLRGGQSIKGWSALAPEDGERIAVALREHIERMRGFVAALSAPTQDVKEA